MIKHIFSAGKSPARSRVFTIPTLLQRDMLITSNFRFSQKQYKLIFYNLPGILKSVTDFYPLYYVTDSSTLLYSAGDRCT